MTPQGANSEQPPAVVVERVTARGLERLRQRVSGVARDAGLDADRVARLTLAVNELATNAIKHGGQQAEVTIRAQNGHVMVDVEDHGSGIPPEVTASRPGPGAVGGRGLWLATELCDRLDIVTGQGGTRVRVVMAVTPG